MIANPPGINAGNGSKWKFMSTCTSVNFMWENNVYFPMNLRREHKILKQVFYNVTSTLVRV